VQRTGEQASASPRHLWFTDAGIEHAPDTRVEGQRFRAEWVTDGGRARMLASTATERM
jgi:hypothetical protein